MGKIEAYLLRERIRTAIARLILGHDYVRFVGIVRVRELPYGITEKDFLEWWPRVSPKERDRYTAAEHRNILTTNGRNQLLTYVSSGLATTLGFAQEFSVGTFPITSVSPGDTSVQTEIYRAAPNAITITGQQVDISTFFGGSQANGNYTNCGLYGINATSTLGTGTLMTHTLYSYNKVNGQAITNDYLVTLQ